MKNRIIENIKNQLSRVKFKLDRKVLVFLFFLVLSTMFWFLNELSKDTTTLITYPVKYNNIPGNKVLVRELPGEFDLLVKAPGFSLLKHKMTGRLTPIVFDISHYSYNIFSDGTASKFFILTSGSLARINQQFGSDFKVLDISPDTLVFEFDERVQKKVPVKINTDVEFGQQYMIGGNITSQPDSVIISGPGVVIDTIEWVEAQSQKFTSVDQDIKKSIGLIPIKNVDFSTRKVIIIVPVERFTEARFSVPVNVVNIPDTLELKTFPGSINVTCRVPLSDYDKLTVNLFRAIVDYSVIKSNYSNKIKVRLSSAPEYVSNIQIYPISVEFIVEKK